MLTDEEIDAIGSERSPYTDFQFALAIESAATAPLLARIEGLEANEKVLLAQVQGHTKWREKIIKASEQAYGESAIRYKFSLTKNGKCMNTFPKEIDGRWFALVPAEDDGHIGHIARIAELERELEEARKDAELLDWMIFYSARLSHDSDGEFCQCIWINEDGEQRTKLFGNARAAIRAAIKEQT